MIWTPCSLPGEITHSLRHQTDVLLFSECFDFSLANLCVTFCTQVDQRGILSLRGPLDYESSRSHRLFIEAYDQSQYPKTATATVLILVGDVIDEFPEIEFLPWLAFDPHPKTPSGNNSSNNDSNLLKVETVNLILEENNALRLPIAEVRVTDADAADHGRLHCSAHHSNGVNPVAFDFSPLIPGQNVDFTLSLNSSLDRERHPLVYVRISCYDNAWPARTSVVAVYIRVLGRYTI